MLRRNTYHPRILYQGKYPSRIRVSNMDKSEKQCWTKEIFKKEKHSVWVYLYDTQEDTTLNDGSRSGTAITRNGRNLERSTRELSRMKCSVSNQGMITHVCMFAKTHWTVQ